MAQAEENYLTREIVYRAEWTKEETQRVVAYIALEEKPQVKKGYEKIKQIFNYLDDICFGKFHFVVAKILRETLFLSSLLLNSEAWYSIDKKSIEELEKVDNILLKKILELPSSTPAAFVHLELGTLPIRYVIMTRRLLFLQYILKEKGDSLIHSFLVAQMEDTKKGDWWETVQNDIMEIELNLSLSEIKMMSSRQTYLKQLYCG